MEWIFAIFVLVVAAIYAPGFRKVVLAAAGAVVAFELLVRVGEFDRLPSSPIIQTNPVKRLAIRPPRRIPTEQIEVGELRSNFADGVSNIDLRIQNNSAADTLTSADYRLRVDDCQGTEIEPSHCATIGDEKGTILLEVPPKQSRDVIIDTHQPYSVATMLGHPRIKMIITEARATRTPSDRASEGRIAEVIPAAQDGDGRR